MAVPGPEDIYSGRTELYTKSDIATTRRGEIYKLRAPLEEFLESSNVKALLDMYEEINKGVHSYSIIKGYPLQHLLSSRSVSPCPSGP